MSQISSINFKKSNGIQTQHNDRTLPPNYRIGTNDEVSFNRNSSEALAEKNRIIRKAKEAYTKRTKQRFQGKSDENYLWSAVVNLKAESDMQDLEKLAKHFKEKYGFQCYQIAIHRDEGHINELGEKVINHHAHLEFVMLNEKGITAFKKRDFGRNQMRKIQDEVAKILGMKRGIDKRLSGVKRIEPRVYAKIKEQEKKNTKESLKQLTAENTQLKADLSIKEALSYVEKWRNWSKGKFTNEFYNGDNGLNAIKRKIKATKGNIDKAELRQNIRNLIKTSPRQTTQTPQQTKDNTAELVARINDLKGENDKLAKKLESTKRELSDYKAFPKETIDTYRVAIVKEMKFDFPNVKDCLIKAFELETKKDNTYYDFFLNPDKISESCLNLAKKMIENFKAKFPNFFKERETINTKSR